ncbi:hypothetical protein I6N96_12210 [Enterococcus sp. BWM-S5]|uniref:Uncharacterized protein n=1 Tax=Enterococcus larvae TaxID=2794352 RepID=A0ABS4CLW5_9ENTE|nr:hypothetical protein [Enterococcus larvae]MBP1047035.1 hypothetical protein [Enterococcus larvae]
MDAEPDSNNIHVQAKGGGNGSYKKEIDISMITDKKSVYNLLPNAVKKGLGKGKLDEIVNNIWRAYIWIKA